MASPMSSVPTAQLATNHHTTSYAINTTTSSVNNDQQIFLKTQQSFQSNGISLNPPSKATQANSSSARLEDTTTTNCYDHDRKEAGISKAADIRTRFRDRDEHGDCRGKGSTNNHQTNTCALSQQEQNRRGQTQYQNQQMHHNYQAQYQDEFIKMRERLFRLLSKVPIHVESMSQQQPVDVSPKAGCSSAILSNQQTDSDFNSGCIRKNKAMGREPLTIKYYNDRYLSEILDLHFSCSLIKHNFERGMALDAHLASKRLGSATGQSHEYACPIINQASDCRPDDMIVYGGYEHQITYGYHQYPQQQQNRQFEDWQRGGTMHSDWQFQTYESSQMPTKSFERPNSSNRLRSTPGTVASELLKDANNNTNNNLEVLSHKHAKRQQRRSQMTRTTGTVAIEQHEERTGSNSIHLNGSRQGDFYYVSQNTIENNCRDSASLPSPAFNDIFAPNIGTTQQPSASNLVGSQLTATALTTPTPSFDQNRPTTGQYHNQTIHSHHHQHRQAHCANQLQLDNLYNSPYQIQAEPINSGECVSQPISLAPQNQVELDRTRGTHAPALIVFRQQHQQHQQRQKMTIVYDNHVEPISLEPSTHQHLLNETTSLSASNYYQHTAAGYDPQASSDCQLTQTWHPCGGQLAHMEGPDLAPIEQQLQQQMIDHNTNNNQNSQHTTNRILSENFVRGTGLYAQNGLNSASYIHTTTAYVSDYEPQGVHLMPNTSTNSMVAFKSSHGSNEEHAAATNHHPPARQSSSSVA